MSRKRSERADIVGNAQLVSSLRWGWNAAGHATLTIEMRRWVSPAAIRVFSGIAGAWNMGFAEQARLLALPLPVWSKCKRGVPVALQVETLKRIARTARIFEAINLLLPPDRADAWMRSPNAIPGFPGHSAIDAMIEEGRAGIAFVQQYLLAELNS